MNSKQLSTDELLNILPARIDFNSIGAARLRIEKYPEGWQVYYDPVSDNREEPEPLDDWSRKEMDLKKLLESRKGWLKHELNFDKL